MNRSARFVARLFAVAVVCAALGAPPAHALKTPRVSPNATLSQTVGVTDVSLTWSRPGVKGRPIWGALVPFGQTWRTGANEATTLTFTDDVTFGGKPVPAGRYAFFTFPGKEDWTLVLSRQKELWGAFGYDSTQDVVRVSSKPESAEMVEWLTFEFDSLTARSARLSIRWEKLRVPVEIRVNTDAVFLASARKAIAEAKPDDWTTPFQGARYIFDNNLANTDEMNQWLDLSSHAKVNFQNQDLRSRVLAKAGRKAEAIALAEKALAAEKARVLEKGESRAETGALEKLLADWKK